MNASRLHQTATDHSVELLVQFGSTVTGATHPQSDVDLAVLFREGDRLADRAADLSLALRAAMPGDIDLAILNHADPLLLKQPISRAASSRRSSSATSNASSAG